MNIVICDDDLSVRTQLSILCAKAVDPCIEIICFPSAEALIQWLKTDPNHSIDILVLDIDLPGKKGVTLLRELRTSIKSDCLVLFVTNYDHYVSDGFYYNAFQYLIKPVDPEKFMSEIQRAVDKFKRDHMKLTIASKTGNILVDYRELFYIESRKRVLTYHTLMGCYDSYDTLTRVETLLASYDFLRCHKSYLVNMSKITRWDNYTFYLIDGSSVDISVHKKSKVLSAFYEYQRRRLVR